MKKLLLPFLCLLLGTNAHAQVSVPSYVPHLGLIAWFPFAGNAIDSSGHGHNGTMHGTTPVADRFGNPNAALYFNGTSDYIYVPPGTPGYDQSTDITASLTISAWVKSRNYTLSSQEQIYWRGDATPAHDPHMLYFNSGDIRIRRDVDPGTTSNEVGTPVTALDTNFHMLTGTYDSASGVMSIYIDGVLKDSKSLPGFETYPTSTMYNYIGAVDGGTWQFFYGVMDELGLWNRALTPCEIAGLYYYTTGVISGNPVNDTVFSGKSASFTIADTISSATFQWQVNTGSGFTDVPAGSPYSGGTTKTLTVSPVTTAMSGYKYRCVHVSGSCTSDTSDAAQLTVHLPSICCAPPPQVEMTVVPNPGNGEFTVSGSLPDNSYASLVVTNMLGQVVYATGPLSLAGWVNEHFTLGSSLPGGMYLLRVASDSYKKVIPILLQR